MNYIQSFGCKLFTFQEDDTWLDEAQIQDQIDVSARACHIYTALLVWPLKLFSSEKYVAYVW